MLCFYEFNNLNIFIVLFTTFIIYNLLCKKNKDKNKDKNNLNLDKLIYAFIFGILLSLISSYMFAMKNEQLLTDNYWELSNS